MNTYMLYETLINSGHIEELHKLTLTNKNLLNDLSTKDRLQILLYTSKLNEYYNMEDIGGFEHLYRLYKTLDDKKIIYKYINKTFKHYDFERAQYNDVSLIGIFETYDEFMKFQWETLLEINNIKEINFLKYIVEVGGGFGCVDKENMVVMFNDGIVFDADGNLCFTTPR